MWTTDAAQEPHAPHGRRLPTLHRRRLAAAAFALAAACSLPGCATLGPGDPPRVHVVGVERLESEGFELRLAIKLRVQNPRSLSLGYEGLSLELDVNGRPLASGVSPAKGEVPAYGEVLLTVPVSVSASSVLRQMLALADGRSSLGEMPYALRGRLGGGLLGGTRFATEGSLRLPAN